MIAGGIRTKANESICKMLLQNTSADHSGKSNIVAFQSRFFILRHVLELKKSFLPNQHAIYRAHSHMRGTLRLFRLQFDVPDAGSHSNCIPRRARIWPCCSQFATSRPLSRCHLRIWPEYPLSAYVYQGCPEKQRPCSTRGSITTHACWWDLFYYGDILVRMDGRAIAPMDIACCSFL
jgi:hypothetical protein